jgi:hypothetical protein
VARARRPWEEPEKGVVEGSLMIIASASLSGSSLSGRDTAPPESSVQY